MLEDEIKLDLGKIQTMLENIEFRNEKNKLLKD